MTGKYYDELNVGIKIQHSLGRTVTETDNVLFNSLTMNTQPLHLNVDFASKTQFGRPIVNGILTLGIVVGITVGDLTEGTIIANLGYGQVKHPRPVFHGDTIYVETEVLEKRESKSINASIIERPEMARANLMAVSTASLPLLSKTPLPWLRGAGARLINFSKIST